MPHASNTCICFFLLFSSHYLPVLRCSSHTFNIFLRFSKWDEHHSTFVHVIFAPYSVIDEFWKYNYRLVEVRMDVRDVCLILFLHQSISIEWKKTNKTKNVCVFKWLLTYRDSIRSMMSLLYICEFMWVRDFNYYICLFWFCSVCGDICFCAKRTNWRRKRKTKLWEFMFCFRIC